MRDLTRSRKFMLGASIAGIAAAFAGQALFHQNVIASAKAQPSGDPMVPVFQADPYWPQPLPNGWIQGQTIGLSADKNDNIWVIHRPGSMEANETLAARDQGDCCTPAPDIMEFNQQGKLLTWINHQKIGMDHDWPSENHGITVAPDGNLWISGESSLPPPPPAGSAASYKKPAPGAESEGEEGGRELARNGKAPYHDSFLLEISPEGKFVGEIGHANGTVSAKGSLDTENTRGVATTRFLPDGTLVAADGYGNRRVSEWNPKTFKIVRFWGAYGKPPIDGDMEPFNSNATQFGNPVHCAQPSKDGLLYVCDRMNDRIQVFKFDGTYVNQYIMEPDTRGPGSTWEIALSNDPGQKYLFISDGSNQKIHVWDRATMKELYWFGGGGRQPGRFYAVHSIITDSKGNLYTSETFHGQRVQKWNYQGLKPLSVVLKMGHVGNSSVGAPNTKPQ